MHWFDHFLTKLPKYWWIKTGDRHYHFVEPWVIDRPFCRMETLYRSHFVETGVGSLQNGAPQPPPQGMARRINIVHIVSQFHAFKKQVADCDGLATMNLLVAHLRTAYISFAYYMAVRNEIKCLLVINFCLSMTSHHHPSSGFPIILTTPSHGFMYVIVFLL